MNRGVVKEMKQNNEKFVKPTLYADKYQKVEDKLINLLKKLPDYEDSDNEIIMEYLYPKFHYDMYPYIIAGNIDYTLCMDERGQNIIKYRNMNESDAVYWLLENILNSKCYKKYSYLQEKGDFEKYENMKNKSIDNAMAILSEPYYTWHVIGRNYSNMYLIAKDKICLGSHEISFPYPIKEALSYSNTHIIWFCADTPDVSKQPLNNLYAYDDNGKEIWNVKKTLERDELIVGISVTGANSFRFTTFMGICYEIDVRDFNILNTRVTK